MYTQTTSRMICTMTAVLLAALALALLAGPSAGLADDPAVQMVYVDADAGPGGDGQSWGTAYRYLQDALDETNTHKGSKYEIWVAEGVYTPDEDGDGDHANNDEEESFTLSYNNVQLYGGFAAGETARNQRDWDANVTVLSGDIDGNDTTDAHGVVTTTTNIKGNNAYHVLLLEGVTNEPITGTTVLDGFAITAGQADGDWPDHRGGGLLCNASGDAAGECSPTLTNIAFSANSADSGGAMYNWGYYGVSSPMLTNVTFSANSADSGGALYNDGFSGGASSPTLISVTFTDNSAALGGAMYSYGYDGVSSPTLTNVAFSDNSAVWGGAMYNWAYGGASSPTLTNVTFTGNSAEQGGAMYNFSYNGGSSPTLTNVAFTGNSAEYVGGAMFNWASGGVSSPNLTNVTFSGNSAADIGGAIFNLGTDGGASSPTLTNVTFSHNSSGKGGAMYSDGYDSSTSSPALANVILWGNSATGAGDQMYNYYAMPAIGYSLVEEGWDGSGVYNDASTVTNNGGNIDADPQFVDAAGGNLRLQSTSPAIDAGDNSAVPPDVTTDLDGSPRFADIPAITDTGSGTPPIVDMGAYEVQNRVYLPSVIRNRP